MKEHATVPSPERRRPKDMVGSPAVAAAARLDERCGSLESQETFCLACKNGHIYDFKARPCHCGLLVLGAPDVCDSVIKPQDGLAEHCKEHWLGFGQQPHLSSSPLTNSLSFVFDRLGQVPPMN